MINAFVIPVQPGIPQAMTISLSGKVYRLTLTWCPPAACWILEVDDINGNRILAGVPLVTGADLLEQYAYLGIGEPGAMLIVQTENDPVAVPTFTSLGNTGELYYVTP